MASRANENEEDIAENGDAPLIDLNDATVKKLLAKAKRRGFLTYDELNAALPQDQMSSEQIEDVMSAINDMGVQIVENDEAGEDSEEQEEEVETIDNISENDPRSLTNTIKKTGTGERTDDPVRMYLREMGAVELLSREGEIAIAKRIESGRDTMILGLVRKPDHLPRDHRMVKCAQRRRNAAARNPRSRRHALESARSADRRR